MSDTRDYLVISMAAILASMGDIAGWERRGSLEWPARSAILGLIAAALGIRRDDVNGHRELEGLSMCVAVFDERSQPLRDYHTVQTVPTTAAKLPDSRRAALQDAGDKVVTTITQRDYRMGVHFGVALWGNGGRPLPEIAAALRCPTFTLYFGRKSCPFAAPLAPRIVSADTPIKALAQTPPPPWRDKSRPVNFYATDRFDGAAEDRVETRQDNPLDRVLWHFEARELLIINPGESV